MRFLLVVPKFVVNPAMSYDFPLGLAYISAVLKRAGHEVHCLNLNNFFDKPEDLIARTIEDVDPDIFGTGTLSPFFDQVEEILRAAKAAKPGMLTIVGGGVVSADPETSLPMLGADIGVIGEGDETVLELASSLETGGDLSGIPGIIFLNSHGTPVRTPPRKAIGDLDALPWPDYEGFGADDMVDICNPTDNYFYQTGENPRSLPMIASRSCPYACTFCYHPTGRVYRMRSLDSFFAELDFMIERFGINMIALLDEIFAVKKRRLMDFCARIKPYGIKWMVQLHVSTVDEEVLDAMHDAGCTYISYGLESANDAVLKSMQKKATRAQIEAALELTRKKKIGIQGNFIFGDAAETLETANDTVDWWANHRQYHISLSEIQVYPGSPLYARARSEGLIPDRREILRNPHINPTALDDRTYKRLLARLMVFKKTLTNPAKIITFEERDDPTSRRGGLYLIEWICPGCGARNTHRNVAMDRIDLYQNTFLTCFECRGRADIENRDREPWFHEEAEGLYEQAHRLRSSGRVGEAVNKYMEVLGVFNFTPAGNCPDAVIRAAHDLGAISLASGRHLAYALLYLALALNYKIYNPHYHLSFAVALLAEGSVDAARLHCGQARKLVELNGGAPGEIERLEELIATAATSSGGDGAPRYFAG